MIEKVCIGIIYRTNSNGKTEYLLVASAKDFGQYTGYYYPPGGHIQVDESPEELLRRKIPLEVGLQVAPIRCIAETDADIPNQITYWWECSYSGELLVNYTNVRDANFFTREEMKNLPIWPATKSFFNKYIFKAEYLSQY